jgi:serine/threonine protein phosphatase PrpC
LCSDGLYDLVEDFEIREAVVSNKPHDACDKLISLSKERGGFDNVTVAIIEIRPPGIEPPAPPETREVEMIGSAQGGEA